MSYRIALACGLAVAHPAAAQDRNPAERPGGAAAADITVVATGSPTPIDRSGQSISVIGADEIARVQGPDLTRVLERAPGVTITRNGGLGGFTGVRVRGASAEQLLVLVDGVRVADVAAPSGGTDFGNLLAGEFGRAELLRGSNSVVWGSDAIGGVLALTTRTPRGFEAAAEAGAHDSYSAQAGWGTEGPRGALRLGGGHARTDGISTAAVGTEADGFRQWNLHGGGRLAVTSAVALTATARAANARLDIDGFPAPLFAFADTAERQHTRQLSGRVGARWEGAALTLDAGYALADHRRKLRDPAAGADPTFTSRGRSRRAELFGVWRAVPGWTLDFGADHQRDRFVTGPSFGARGRATLASGHALLGWQRGRGAIAAGVRVDDHSRFGSAVTLGANGSVRLADDWRLRGSYGEGFKAPTLFQLLSNFGNPALEPERSRSADLAIERGDRNGPLHLALTAFRRDSRDLIDFVSCFGVTSAICAGRPFGTYDNIARARAEGFELELGARPARPLSVAVVYSYVKSRDRASGRDLARRPRHAVTLSADWDTPLVAGFGIGADLRMVSDSFDDAANAVRLDGYALATLRARLPLGDRFELFGRVENLFDARYQTAAGYGTDGRSGYIGARARF